MEAGAVYGSDAFMTVSVSRASDAICSADIGAKRGWAESVGG